MLKLNAEETSQEQQQQQQKTLLSNASADGSPRATTKTTTATSPSQQVSKAKVSFHKAQWERGEVQLQVEGGGSRKKCVRPLPPLSVTHYFRLRNQNNRHCHERFMRSVAPIDFEIVNRLMEWGEWQQRMGGGGSSRREQV